MDANSSQHNMCGCEGGAYEEGRGNRGAAGLTGGGQAGAGGGAAPARGGLQGAASAAGAIATC